MRHYLDFAAKCNNNALAPTQYHILTYIAHLEGTLTTPGTVLNYLSVQYVSIQHIPSLPYEERSPAGSDTHTPAQAPPLTPQDIKMVIAYLTPAGPTALMIKAVLLIAYHTLLCQSTLLYAGT